MKNFSLIFIAVVLFACKTGETTTASDTKKDKALPIIELRAGHNSGFIQAVNKVITTQEELTEVWTVLFANYMKKENAPEIDFEHNIVVLVAAGEKNSGGFSIAVTRALATSSNVQLTVVSTSPGKNCVLTEAITYPFQLIQLQKTGQDVVFNASEKVIDCESE